MSLLDSSRASQDAPHSARLAWPASWRGSLERWLPTLIALVAAALYLPPISQYSANYDEGVYWQSLRAMQAGHPLFSSVFSSQPPYFLASIYPFYLLFGQSIAAARVGVVVFAIIGVVAIFWLGSQLGGFWVGVIASALLVFEPNYLAQARTLESDGPAVAVSIVAVALAVAATRRTDVWRRRLAALSGVVIAYGILIKLFDVVALLPMALYLAAPIFSAFDAGDGRLRRPDAATLRAAISAALPDLLAWAVGGVVAGFALLLPFLGSFDALWSQVVSFHTAQQQGLGPQLEGKLVVSLMSFLTLGVLALIVVALAVWQRAWRVAPLLVWTLAAIFTLTRLTTYFGHYAVLVSPSLALLVALAPTLVAPLAVSLAARASAARWLNLAVTVAVLIALAQSAFTDFTPVNARNVGSAPNTTVVAGIPPGAQTHLAAINAFTMPGEVIVTDDQYVAAQAGHSVPPELVDTSFVRVTTGYLTSTRIERVIERDHIRVVILGTQRLSKVPGFLPWLQSRFVLVAHAGANYDIYVRVASGPPIA